MHFPPRTILGQLVAGLLVVQAVVFGAFLAVTVQYESRRSERVDRQRLMRQADTLTNVLREPLASQDATAVDQISRAIPISLTIGSVRITGRDGKTLRTSGNGLKPDLTVQERGVLADLLLHPGFRLLEDEQGRQEAVESVVSNGVVCGVVWIAPDPSVIRRYEVMNLRNVVVYGVCALCGNLVLVWWVSASTTRPLRQLRLATQQLQREPNDSSAFPLPAEASNEVGELQASFNAMVVELALKRRGTQDALKLLDSLLECAPVGFAFFDSDLRFVRVNGALAAMNRLSVQAHIGRRYRDLLAPGASTKVADSAEKLIQSVFKTGKAVEEHELSGPSLDGGAVHTWKTTMFPVQLTEEEVRWVGVIAVDITERKLAEEALRRSERMASAGRLAASIAHEINNPLESVTNLLYLLRMNKSLDWEAQEYVGLAQTEVSRAADITQQTLKFHRKSTLPADVHVPELLQSVLMLHQPRLQNAGIHVQLELSDEAISFGFTAELRQVFGNLVGAAVEAMPKGGRLRVRARAVRWFGQRGTRVTIADTGTGMCDIARQHLFEPLFTLKEAASDGLGLWVNAEALARHKATLQVRSRVAVAPATTSGTVFSVFLPFDGVPRGPVIVTS